ncbi:hypothetical protein [Arthrobacter sp. ISL-5]|uniref:hypothetical protein n=1 Tax=Arthrobacter sp. ISL-5 TaxID=2819111 RepID=UPI001BE4F8F6|nr:hypothetical protein [Arthrobacter sp. ISL-5]MBT2551902.1 hypothetical protein [Arthrobacter sp. ISL-5]
MARMTVNARELKRKSLSSLRTAVAGFNSLDNDGRTTAVLLNLQHAFEMLLKASLDSAKVTVFDKRSEKSISFEAAIRKCQETPGIKVSDGDAGTMRVIDAWRDAEQHWYATVDEGLLYLHVRAAITLYDDLLDKVFGERLGDHLPARVLPISAEPPQDFQLLVDREYARIAELLHPKRRGRGEAHSRIRALLAMESHTDPDAAEIREADVRRVERGVKSGKPRAQVFPKLSTVGSSVSGEGLTVEVKLVKTGGLPMTYVSADSDVEPSAIRTVDLEKKFHMGPYDLADKAGVDRSKATAVRRHFNLDANDDVHSHRFVFGSQKHMRYSDNALKKMKDAKESLYLDDIWNAHRPPLKGKRLPPCTQPGCLAPIHTPAQ